MKTTFTPSTQCTAVCVRAWTVRREKYRQDSAKDSFIAGLVEWFWFLRATFSFMHEQRHTYYTITTDAQYGRKTTPGRTASRHICVYHHQSEKREQNLFFFSPSFFRFRTTHSRRACCTQSNAPKHARLMHRYPRRDSIGVQNNSGAREERVSARVTYRAPGSWPDGTSGTPISGSANAAEMGVEGAFSLLGMIVVYCAL